MNNIFLCKICGHIEFIEAPERCPVCGASKSNFIEDPHALNPAEKEGKEKHVPVIVTSDTCGLIPGECKDVHIKVGSVPHPMQDDHWIQWIDVYINNKFSSRYMMNPQSLKAAVSLHIKNDQSGNIKVIEHCNKHGNWWAESKL